MTPETENKYKKVAALKGGCASSPPFRRHKKAQVLTLRLVYKKSFRRPFLKRLTSNRLYGSDFNICVHTIAIVTRNFFCFGCCFDTLSKAIMMKAIR